MDGQLVGTVYIKTEECGSLLISEDYLNWNWKSPPAGEIPLQFWMYEGSYFTLTRSGSIFSTSDWKTWTAEANIGKSAPASIKAVQKDADILLFSGTGWVQWFNCSSKATAAVPLGESFNRLITVFDGMFYAGNADALWSSADGLQWQPESNSQAAPIAIEPETGSLIGVRMDATMHFHLKHPDGSWTDMEIHYSPNYRLAGGYLETETHRFNLRDYKPEPPASNRIAYEDANIILYANDTIYWKQLDASFLLERESPPRGNRFFSLESSVILVHNEYLYLWEQGFRDPVALLLPPGIRLTNYSTFTLDNRYPVFLQDTPDGMQFALWRDGQWQSIVPSIAIEDYSVRQYGELFVLIQHTEEEGPLDAPGPNKFYSQASHKRSRVLNFGYFCMPKKPGGPKQHYPRAAGAKPFTFPPATCSSLRIETAGSTGGSGAVGGKVCRTWLHGKYPTDMARLVAVVEHISVLKRIVGALQPVGQFGMHVLLQSTDCRIVLVGP
jgi:hypothetical protein